MLGNVKRNIFANTVQANIKGLVDFGSVGLDAGGGYCDQASYWRQANDALFKRAGAVKVIYVAGWDSTHRPIDSLFQATSALTLIL